MQNKTYLIINVPQNAGMPQYLAPCRLSITAVLCPNETTKAQSHALTFFCDIFTYNFKICTNLI